MVGLLKAPFAPTRFGDFLVFNPGLSWLATTERNALFFDAVCYIQLFLESDNAIVIQCQVMAALP